MEQLVDMWLDKTPEQARAILKKPDVSVTSQKDKDVQLKKILQLNDAVKRSFVASNEPISPSSIRRLSS